MKESFGGIQVTPVSININGKSVDLDKADILYFYFAVAGQWNSEKIVEELGYEFSISKESIDYNSTQQNCKLEMKLSYDANNQIFSIKDKADLIETDAYTFTVSEGKEISEDIDEELKKIITDRFEIDGFGFEN